MPSMTTFARPFRRFLGRGAPPDVTRALPAIARQADNSGVAVDIPPSDALFAYLQAARGPVDLRRLELVSPALDELRTAGVRLVVPLVSQGELIGLLNLGPRLSEQEYSSRRPPAARQDSPRRRRRRSASRSWSASRQAEAPSASASSRR